MALTYEELPNDVEALKQIILEKENLLEELNSRLESSLVLDPLTGVLTRHAFMGRVEQQIALAQRHAQRCSLLYMNLDNIKELNDRYGYDVGDTLFQEFAKVLIRSSRTEDVVARFKGAEFVIFSPLVSEEGTTVLANRILEATREISIEGIETPFSVSIGLADYSPDQPFRSLIKYAESAGLFAKEKGKDRLVRWSELA